MSSPDSGRPAPRWGEYATPEEVAALHPHLAETRSEPVEAPPAAPPAAVDRPRHAWDGPITVGLLVLGAWNVVGSVPTYLDFGTVVRRAGQLAGLADVTIGPSAHTAGIVAIVIDIVLLFAAVIVSFLRLRRGRLAFWVPLVAGALSLLTVSVLGLIVLNDSGLGAIVQNHG